MGKVNRAGSNSPEQMVITPGGLRPASKVHLIEQGYHVSGKDGVARKIHTQSGTVVRELGLVNTAVKKDRLSLRKTARKKARGLTPAELAAPYLTSGSSIPAGKMTPARLLNTSAQNGLCPRPQRRKMAS